MNSKTVKDSLHCSTVVQSLKQWAPETELLNIMSSIHPAYRGALVQH